MTLSPELGFVINTWDRFCFLPPKLAPTSRVNHFSALKCRAPAMRFNLPPIHHFFYALSASSPQINWNFFFFNSTPHSIRRPLMEFPPIRKSPKKTISFDPLFIFSAFGRFFGTRNWQLSIPKEFFHSQSKCKKKLDVTWEKNTVFKFYQGVTQSAEGMLMEG